MNSAEVQVEDPSDEEVLDFTYSITSYGADYPVDSLINRLRNGKIRIPPFQRGFVWSEGKASRFIESLLLGLPVPGIFLSRDMDSADLLVIDGQQRLKSLLYFYDGHIEERVFRLRDVQARFEGKTYKELETDDRQRLDDSIIHATIVKQDEPSEDNSSIYLIFERLNTGGMLLQPQEVRSAIYPGQFAELLRELNEYPAWRKVYGDRSARLKDQEFILRFLAMYFYKDKYKKPLKGFLNNFMARNRDFQLADKERLASVFMTTVDYVANTLGKTAFRPVRAINASVFDSMMVGIAHMLSGGAKPPKKNIFLSAYKGLLDNKEYLIATTDATSDEPVVAKRMSLAIDTFAKLK